MVMTLTWGIFWYFTFNGNWFCCVSRCCIMVYFWMYTILKI